MEEIDRLRMMNVIQDYHQQTCEELILDTRQVYDFEVKKLSMEKKVPFSGS